MSSQSPQGSRLSQFLFLFLLRMEECVYCLTSVDGVLQPSSSSLPQAGLAL